MLDKIKGAFARITWPQVALLAVLIAAVLYAAERLPEERWDGLVSLGLAVLASLGLAVGSPLVRRGGGGGGAALALLGVLAIGGTLVGCGASPYTTARTTLATGARLMANADRELAAQRIETAERIAADPAATAPVFDEAMAPFDEALAITLDVRDSMIATQAGIDAAERGEQSDWPAMLGCVALGTSQLVALADRRGLRIPPEARPFVVAVLDLGASACPAGGAR